MSEYLISFVALNPEPLPREAADRLAGAVAGMPGLLHPRGATGDEDAREVRGGFSLVVEMAMAEAARDGSRLAKEALKLAGMDDAKLVELRIVLADSAR